jgi:hypothetical protein
MRFKKGSLLKIWSELRESGSPSDFPNIMADVQHKMLIKAFKGWPSSWNLFCKSTTVDDFKSHNRKWLSEIQDLKKRLPGGPYQSGTMKDYGYSIALETFGETFNLLRETVINDDLNAFQDVPTKLGRAAGRTIAKKVCEVLESNPNAYDGSSLIRAANSSSDALTADVTGIAAVQNGMKVIATATDPHTSEILGMRAKYLVVSPAKADVAQWLLNSTAIARGSTDGPNSNPLLSPALSGGLTLVVEPYLTAFPNRWYLFADPQDLHAIEVTMLEGQTEPALLMAPPAQKLGGGDDQWGYAYDDIEYKCRMDWGISPAFYQAIFKGGS